MRELDRHANTHYNTGEEGGCHMPVSQKRAEQQAEWDKENTCMYTLKLNKHTDAELIAKLDKQPSKAGYIKQLIREDIKKTGT